MLANTTKHDIIFRIFRFFTDLFKDILYIIFSFFLFKNIDFFDV